MPAKVALISAIAMPVAYYSDALNMHLWSASFTQNGQLVFSLRQIITSNSPSGRLCIMQQDTNICRRVAYGGLEYPSPDNTCHERKHHATFPTSATPDGGVVSFGLEEYFFLGARNTCFLRKINHIMHRYDFKTPNTAK